MDQHHHSQLFEVGGAHVSRLEDIRLITGNGKYSSDWNAPDQLHACFLRSDRAHARIVSIDYSKVSQIKGVVGVYTGDDAKAAGYLRSANFLTFAGKGGMKAKVPDRPCIAIGKVRFVGDIVAMVIAESHLAAQDACELIDVNYEDLPAVIDPAAALAPGAPQLHDEIPGNAPFEAETGNEAEVTAAIANAAHVTKLTVDCTRVTASPMEPRAALIEFDAKNDSYIVHTPSQGVNMTRRQFAGYTNLGEDKFRVEIQDVGGGFGQRSTVYPEYISMMIAAKALQRPIKWVSTRTESFLSDTHGRGNIITATLALDKNGQFTGLRIDWLTDMGAFLSPTGPVSHIRNPSTCLNGVYKIPALYGHFKVALTNTMLVAAYRGAGRPDIAYAIERVVDAAALELKMDPADLRRRNYIPTNEYPYKTATGSTYECADLPGLSAKALALADWSGFEARKAASIKKGKLRGIGMSTVIENTGAGMYPKDEIEISVDAKGIVTAHSVAQSQGQSHETTFAMVISNALDIPVENIKIRQGDPDKATTMIGNHSGGSRTMVGAGTVCHIAANKLIDAGKSLAAEDLNVEPSQVTYSKGEFHAKASKKKITLAQLAAKKTLCVRGEGTFLSTFPNGCHIAEVEIDPETGVTEIASYLSVDDCGHVVSHTVVEGQMHGAVVQGLGQVFGEHIVYDKDSGQMLTGSFSDYFMPRAGQHLKSMRMEEHTTLSKVGPLGIKGMGESGCTASLGALVNAMSNALGVRHIDMPLTPSKVWKTIQQSKATN
jgi:carbon-monoxide dehydrogenase large subunit